MRCRMSALTVLSLFAGIGGLDLGLERAGMRVVGQVEIDPYCRDTLNARRAELGKDPVYLTRYGKPLRHVVDDGDGSCDSGWCAT